MDLNNQPETSAQGGNEEGSISSRVSDWLQDQSDKSVKTGGAAIDLSVIVPAFNEQWRLPTTLIDMVDFFDSRPEKWEILVVDDGSSDNTCEMVRKFQRIRPEIRLVSYKPNRGKGHAVRTGVLSASGKTILFADADGATPIREVDRLQKAIAAGHDVAIGSRALSSPDTKVTTSWYRKYPGRIFNFCVNSLILPGFMDTQCGFKMFSAKAARFLFSLSKADGWCFDVEILFIARRAGLQTAEIPINWVNVPGSKVNMLRDSLKMLRDIFVFRLRHRNISPADYPA